MARLNKMYCKPDAHVGMAHGRVDGRLAMHPAEECHTPLLLARHNVLHVMHRAMLRAWQLVNSAC